MKNVLKDIAVTCCCISFLASCSKKDNNNTQPAITSGKVKMEFFNVVGGSNLNMLNQWYKNENGDSFTVSTFNYYISNVVLTNTNGQTYVEPNSYHLVQQSDLTTTSFDLPNVPSGTYSSVTFMIGVDSLHNVSGAQSGALDPTNGMFWSWNTGYIMLKFEGNSPKSSVADGKLTFHSGGFSGPDNVLKTLTLTFPQPIEVPGTLEPHIHLQADVLSLFKSPNKIDFSVLNTIHMPGTDAKNFSDNYANMFTITYAGI